MLMIRIKQGEGAERGGFYVLILQQIKNIHLQSDITASAKPCQDITASATDLATDENYCCSYIQ